MTLITHPDDSITLSLERKIICLQAAWELDALAKALPPLNPYCGCDETTCAHLVIRGIAARMASLAGVLNDGLGDNHVLDQTLQAVVMVTP
jgi:hypothetical protein